MNWWRRHMRSREGKLNGMFVTLLLSLVLFFLSPLLFFIYFSSFQFVFITIHKYFISIVCIFLFTLNCICTIELAILSNAARLLYKFIFSLSLNAFRIVCTYYSRSLILNLLRAELTVAVGALAFFFSARCYYTLCFHFDWAIMSNIELKMFAQFILYTQYRIHSLYWTCVYAFGLYYFYLECVNI